MQIHPTLRSLAIGLSFAVFLPIGTSCDGGDGTGGSTGGSAGGGAGGTGGNTGGTGGGSVCADVCPAVVAAGCTNGPPDEAACESGCASVVAMCGTEFNALLQCGGDNPMFVCDADGTPYPSGCDAENAALGSCLSGVPALCAAICPSVVAAGCNAGPPDEASCEAGCANGKTQCPTEFAALEQCAPASPMATCDANGSPNVVGCENETVALLMCLSQ